MILIIEIRQGEGGDDAKDLVLQQYSVYKRYCEKHNLQHELLKQLPGLLSFKVSGKDAFKYFRKEAGGHRWQRVPPTEKRGRKHTSSITVAVLKEQEQVTTEIGDDEITVRRYKAGGKGGQHRNKTDSAIELTHIPTGIKAKCDSERCQHTNKRIALALLEQKIRDCTNCTKKSKRDSLRRDQVGTGLRGDKIRTIQEQNDQVTDHRTGKKISFKKYVRGELTLLW